MELKTISVDKVLANFYQPRTKFDKERQIDTILMEKIIKKLKEKGRLEEAQKLKQVLNKYYENEN